MYKFRFGLGIPAETDVGAACLEVQEVGAGRNFPVAVRLRQPYFQIVSSGTGEAQVTGAQPYHMVGQAQQLQCMLRVVCQAFQFVPALFRTGKFN